MFETIIIFTINLVNSIGYFGIFALMTIESSIIPFPSEIIMIPAGYLVFEGKMNIYLAILSGVLGSIFGALINYYIAIRFGRKFLDRYGKYFLISQKTIRKSEIFFQKHGSMSTFTGRLLPAIRQYISIPAGISRMNLAKFIIFTTLGAGIWVSILVIFGYYLGVSLEINLNDLVGAFFETQKNVIQNSIKYQFKILSYTIIGIVVIVGICYIYFQIKKNKNKNNDVINK